MIKYHLNVKVKVKVFLSRQLSCYSEMTPMKFWKFAIADGRRDLRLDTHINNVTLEYSGFAGMKIICLFLREKGSFLNFLMRTIKP